MDLNNPSMEIGGSFDHLAEGSLYDLIAIWKCCTK